jgi:hypothetical protein
MAQSSLLVLLAQNAPANAFSSQRELCVKINAQLVPLPFSLMANGWDNNGIFSSMNVLRAAADLAYRAVNRLGKRCVYTKAPGIFNVDMREGAQMP